eukprot:scaffold931_cov117-Isochrysis_galbana.AAC.5
MSSKADETSTPPPPSAPSMSAVEKRSAQLLREPRGMRGAEKRPLGAAHRRVEHRLAPAITVVDQRPALPQVELAGRRSAARDGRSQVHASRQQVTRRVQRRHPCPRLGRARHVQLEHVTVCGLRVEPAGAERVQPAAGARKDDHLDDVALGPGIRHAVQQLVALKAQQGHGANRRLRRRVRPSRCPGASRKQAARRRRVDFEACLAEHENLARKGPAARHADRQHPAPQVGLVGRERLFARVGSDVEQLPGARGVVQRSSAIGIPQRDAVGQRVAELADGIRAGAHQLLLIRAPRRGPRRARSAIHLQVERRRDPRCAAGRGGVREASALPTDILPNEQKVGVVREQARGGVLVVLVHCSEERITRLGQLHRPEGPRSHSQYSPLQPKDRTPPLAGGSTAARPARRALQQRDRRAAAARTARTGAPARVCLQRPPGVPLPEKAGRAGHEQSPAQRALQPHERERCVGAQTGALRPPPA